VVVHAAPVTSLTVVVAVDVGKTGAGPLLSASWPPGWEVLELNPAHVAETAIAGLLPASHTSRRHAHNEASSYTTSSTRGQRQTDLGCTSCAPCGRQILWEQNDVGWHQPPA
jgi:hypothetical protein